MAKLSIEYTMAYNDFVDAYAEQFGLDTKQRIHFAMKLGEHLELIAEGEES